MKAKNAKKTNSPKSTKTSATAKSIPHRIRAKATAGDGPSPEFKQVVAVVNEKKQQLGLGWKRDAVITYEIGAEIAKVVGEGSRYGSGDVEKLAGEVKLNRATLYRWAKVATTWTKDAFLKLAARRNSENDLPLPWSHYELLCKESNAKRREKIIERAFAEALTVAELRALIKGGPKKTSAGTLPVVTAITKRTDVWNQAHDLVEEQTELVKALSSIAASRYTSEHTELAKELYASCEKLMAAIMPIVKAATATSVEAPVEPRVMGMVQ